MTGKRGTEGQEKIQGRNTTRLRFRTNFFLDAPLFKGNEDRGGGEGTKAQRQREGGSNRDPSRTRVHVLLLSPPCTLLVLLRTIWYV
jgi:hypothetical protein